MLEVRPSCECCDTPLPPESDQACICSFECTYCFECASETLRFVCPNCGGDLVARPVRPVALLVRYPASTVRVVKPEGCAAAARLFGFFPLRQGYRISMYAHGLALRPGTQERHRLPNMAAFGSLELSPQDPIAACGQIGRAHV